MSDLNPHDLLRRWLDLGLGDDLLRAATANAITRYDEIVATSTHPSIDTARLFDPDSSHTTVQSIVADKTLAAQIVDAAELFGSAGFDDRDLVDQIHARYGTSPDRNVVARARGKLEPAGTIVRIGPRTRSTRKVPTTHFVHWRFHND